MFKCVLHKSHFGHNETGFVPRILFANRGAAIFCLGYDFDDLHHAAVLVPQNVAVDDEFVHNLREAMADDNVAGCLAVRAGGGDDDRVLPAATGIGQPALGIIKFLDEERVEVDVEGPYHSSSNLILAIYRLR